MLDALTTPVNERELAPDRGQRISNLRRSTTVHDPEHPQPATNLHRRPLHTTPATAADYAKTPTSSPTTTTALNNNEQPRADQIHGSPVSV